MHALCGRLLLCGPKWKGHESCTHFVFVFCCVVRNEKDSNPARSLLLFSAVWSKMKRTRILHESGPPCSVKYWDARRGQDVRAGSECRKKSAVMLDHRFVQKCLKKITPSCLTIVSYKTAVKFQSKCLPGYRIVCKNAVKVLPGL